MGRFDYVYSKMLRHKAPRATDFQSWLMQSLTGDVEVINQARENVIKASENFQRQDEPSFPNKICWCNATQQYVQQRTGIYKLTLGIPNEPLICIWCKRPTTTDVCSGCGGAGTQLNNQKEK
jgi:hypothetical protein